MCANVWACVLRVPCVRAHARACHAPHRAQRTVTGAACVRVGRSQLARGGPCPRGASSMGRPTCLGPPQPRGGAGGRHAGSPRPLPPGGRVHRGPPAAGDKLALQGPRLPLVTGCDQEPPRVAHTEHMSSRLVIFTPLLRHRLRTTDSSVLAIRSFPGHLQSRAAVTAAEGRLRTRPSLRKSPHSTHTHPVPAHTPSAPSAPGARSAVAPPFLGISREWNCAVCGPQLVHDVSGLAHVAAGTGISSPSCRLHPPPSRPWAAALFASWLL